MFPQTIEVTVNQACVEEAYAQLAEEMAVSFCCPLRQALAQIGFVGTVGVLEHNHEYTFHLWQGNYFQKYLFDLAGNVIAQKFDSIGQKLVLEHPVTVVLTKEN